MNKSEMAEKAAREIYGLWSDDGRPGVPEFGTAEIVKIVERAIAESQAPQPEIDKHKLDCAIYTDDIWVEKVCNCGLGDGEPSPDYKEFDDYDSFRSKHPRLYKFWNEYDEVLGIDPIWLKFALRFVESGASQEVSPVGSVYEIRPRPDDPSCHVCGAKEDEDITMEDVIGKKAELGDGEPSPPLGTCNYWRREHVEGSHDMCLDWAKCESGAAQEVSPAKCKSCGTILYRTLGENGEYCDRCESKQEVSPPSPEPVCPMCCKPVFTDGYEGDTRELKAALWIPVQEKFPEYGTVSLVYGYNDDCEKIPYQDIATYSYHGGWCVGLDKSVEYVVTHWQYLPEPPELG